MTVVKIWVFGCGGRNRLYTLVVAQARILVADQMDIEPSSMEQAGLIELLVPAFGCGTGLAQVALLAQGGGFHQGCCQCNVRKPVSMFVLIAFSCEANKPISVCRRARRCWLSACPRASLIVALACNEASLEQNIVSKLFIAYVRSSLLLACKEARLLPKAVSKLVIACERSSWLLAREASLSLKAVSKEASLSLKAVSKLAIARKISSLLLA